LRAGAAAVRVRRRRGRAGPVHDADRLVELLEAELGDDSLRGSWVAGSAVTGSINALLRRLRSAVKPLNAIIRGDLAHRGEFALKERQGTARPLKFVTIARSGLATVACQTPARCT
jgi:hypothetical protein